MRINTNVEAFNAQRNLSATGAQYAKSVEKLSSGLRINRAGDDAAGLSISEKLRAQIKGTSQAQRNAQDGISMIQTAEGALNETHSMLQRMRELAVQSANDTLTTEDRTAINDELKTLKSEVDAIADRTNFNGKRLLDGSISSSVAGGSEVKLGTIKAQGTFQAAVTSLDVSKAKGGVTYSLSYAAGSDALTLMDMTTLQSQTITVTAGTAGTVKDFDFSQLGVSFSVDPITNMTADELGAVLANSSSDTIVTSGSGAAKFQIGSGTGASDSMSVTFSEVKLTGAANGSDMDVLNDELADFDAAVTADSFAYADATQLIDALDDAIGYVSSVRGSLGAAQNRLEHTIANLGVAQENLSASESRIRDVDMAAEMVSFTKTGILQQAGQSILSQANQAPQGVLSLLR